MLKQGWSCRTGWTSSQLVQTVDKNYEILTKDSSKNKEPKKINGTQFWARMRENWLKKYNMFIKRGWLCKIGWTGSQLVQLIDKNYEILTEYYSKNKEPKKRNGAQFPYRMREN